MDIARNPGPIFGNNSGEGIRLLGSNAYFNFVYNNSTYFVKRADRRAFQKRKNRANNIMNEARRAYFKSILEENSGDQKKLFSVTKNLLGKGKESQFPPSDDTTALTNSFGEFFAQKIVTIQDKLDHMASTLPPKSIVVPPTASTVVPSMECFSLLSESDVRKLIEAAPKKNLVCLIPCLRP